MRFSHFNIDIYTRIFERYLFVEAVFKYICFASFSKMFLSPDACWHFGANLFISII